MSTHNFLVVHAIDPAYPQFIPMGTEDDYKGYGFQHQGAAEAYMKRLRDGGMLQVGDTFTTVAHWTVEGREVFGHGLTWTVHPNGHDGFYAAGKDSGHYCTAVFVF